MEKIKKKIVVVGNCQARPISILLESMSEDIQVIKVAVVHLLNSNQKSEYLPYFESADLIIAQLVEENYPCDFVRTKFLELHYPEKLVKIVNLYFNIYSPDLFYIRDKNNRPLNGPLGDYHSRVIFNAWKDGLRVEEAILKYEGEESYIFYGSLIEESKRIFLEKESRSDICIFDYIDSNYKSKVLFHTFNHPTNCLLEEYTSRILQHIGLVPRRNSLSFEEHLGQFVAPVHPSTNLSESHEIIGREIVSVGNWNSKLGVKKVYSMEELVEAYFCIYENNWQQFCA